MRRRKDSKLAVALEKHYTAIRKELFDYMELTQGASWGDTENPEHQSSAYIINLKQAKNQGLKGRETEVWTSRTLLHHPLKFSTKNCGHFPTVCKLLRKALEVTAKIDGRFVDGEAEFLRLKPDSVLNFHTGSTNERLHLHCKSINYHPSTSAIESSMLYML